MQNRRMGRPEVVARAQRTALPLLLLAFLLVPAGKLHAQTANLDIYWIDVEGGGATLVVSPSGDSLLIDAGFSRPDDRDAKRIYAVTQAAGLKKIDYYLLTGAGPAQSRSSSSACGLLLHAAGNKLLERHPARDLGPVLKHPQTLGQPPSRQMNCRLASGSLYSGVILRKSASR